jgi:hypothetical protein
MLCSHFHFHRPTLPPFLTLRTLVNILFFKLSASSTALDLAQSQSSGAEDPSLGWGNINRHRPQQSLSSLGSGQMNSASSVGSGQSTDVSTIGSRPSTLRHSLDLKYFQESASSSSDTSASIVSPPATHIMTTPPKLQQSFSANDVPTVKSSGSTAGLTGNANNHAQQHFHNHNASLGRIPAGAVPNRLSRELAPGPTEAALAAAARDSGAYPSIGSALQANATPFGGPPSSQPHSSAPASSAVASPTLLAPYQNFYGQNFPNNANGNGNNYGVPMLAVSMQGLSVNGNNNPSAMYPPPQSFTGYNPLYNQAQRVPQDSQARVIQNRRQLDNEGESNYVLNYRDSRVHPTNSISPASHESFC